jgi:putative sterol carrier protein
VPETPHTQIRVSPEVYEELREGRLDAQNAFMGGKLEVTGDLQIAMQLALAALSPE